MNVFVGQATGPTGKTSWDRFRLEIKMLAFLLYIQVNKLKKKKKYSDRTGKNVHTFGKCQLHTTV